jgi:hypothetical protein
MGTLKWYHSFCIGNSVGTGIGVVRERETATVYFISGIYGIFVDIFSHHTGTDPVDSSMTHVWREEGSDTKIYHHSTSCSVLSGGSTAP